MPAKDAEKIVQAAVYIDGKPIKRIQEICGKDGLNGVCVCGDCLKKAAVDPGQIKKLRQINNVLRIEDTDGNIKECVQSLAEILEDLERGNHGKEERKSNTIQTGNKDNL